ncbi:Protein kinase, ATP binding site-containing protein [Artemisia annua]|uniref:Protein kinase, ATP binding site-containing protein n=1 Tax=Artemisia annua TaxID=35608 RepID=A0A2U1NZF1_ARTAN|nr:Protein kinase, ATP binding site-containing protein [Artemisia annua]
MKLVTKQFEHLKIKLEAIKLATNNFADANCIGKGGFGEVYKGELVHSKGHTVVALKRLNRAFGQGDPEFWKEIIMLSLYKYDNIVSLLGFCDESGEKILVYEYASRRSLDLYLDSEDLTWTQRLNICIGAARGLAYLHSSFGTHQRVVHRDIKSSNILLDENWNARISDMGLSKFGPANQQITFLVSDAVTGYGLDPHQVSAETEGVNYEGDKDFLRVELNMLAERKPVSGFAQSRRAKIEAILGSRLIRGESSGYKDFLKRKKQDGHDELAVLAERKPVSGFAQSRRARIEASLRSRLITDPRDTYLIISIL